MTHEGQPAPVRPVPAPPVPPERRGEGVRGHRLPEGVRQKARRGRLAAGQEAQAAQRVGVGEGAGPVPVVGEAGRVDGQAVGEHGGAGGGAVADVEVDAGGVGLARPQAQPVVGVGVAVAVGELLGEQAVLAVPGEDRGLAYIAILNFS